MKNTIIILAAFLMMACGVEDNKTSNFKVEFKGALKNMMHKGDLSAKASLKDLKGMEHVYALGAIENLKGEIQIFDGKSFNTNVEDDAINFDNTLDKNACLLVYAVVENWKSIQIPDAIENYESLEKFIAEQAATNGINIKEPFPFLIDGTANSIDWHVINWKDGDKEHSHEKHIKSGLNGTIENREMEMLGFYSDAHHAIFTHHTTNMHIHMKTTDGKLAGHVDGLILGKGMVLKLPTVK